jgi:hypothetical protein
MDRRPSKLEFPATMVDNIPSRKHRLSKFSLSPSRAKKPAILDVDESLFLPPELWLQILDYLTFDTLWLSRRVNHLWNSAALSRASSIFFSSKVTVDIVMIDDQATPMPPQIQKMDMFPALFGRSFSVNGEHNFVSLPLGTAEPISDKRETITWRARDNTPFHLLNRIYGYRPRLLSVTFQSEGKSWGVEYNLRDHREKSMQLKEKGRREEVWLSQKSKVDSRFPWLRSPNADMSGTLGIIHPQWNLRFEAKYGPQRRSYGELVHELHQIALLEVTLPIAQIVSIWADGMNEKREVAAVWPMTAPRVRRFTPT